MLRCVYFHSQATPGSSVRNKYNNNNNNNNKWEAGGERQVGGETEEGSV